MNCFEIIAEISVMEGKAMVNGKTVNCAELAAELYAQGVDGILLNNLDKTMPGIAAMFRTVSEVSDRVFLPIRVSGAIYETAQMRIYINDGADRAYYNSNGIRNPQFIKDSVKKLGSDYVGVAVDCRKNSDIDIFQVYVSGGKVSAGKDASLWINEAFRLGASDVMVNIMGADNYAKEAKELVTKINDVRIPLLFRGDFAQKQQFAAAYDAGAMGAVSSALGQGKITADRIKKELSGMNIKVR